MSYRGVTIAITMLVWMHAMPAKAYVIRSGVQDGCHESITARAWSSFPPSDDPLFVELVLPGGDTWRKLAQPLAQWLLGEELSTPQSFVFFSLIVGSRAPDTDGRSVSDLATQRQIHPDPRPEGQYVHALRAKQDDEPNGTELAIAGMRASIRRSLTAAVAASLNPPAEQIVSVPVTLDFYDLFYVDVWEPGFLLGEAAHTLEDSFAHAIRSDAYEFRKIVHVLNFVDAIHTGFKEERDGMAHSKHLDECAAEDVAELTFAAQEASADLVDAFLRARQGDEAAVDALLDKWLTQEVCDLEDESCVDPKWLEAARKDPTDPILPNWMICSARHGVGGESWAWLMGWILIAVFGARRARRT